MDFPKGRQSPSPEALLPADGREKTVEGSTTVDNRPSPTPVSKMTYARRTIAVLLVSLLVLNGVASASSWTPCHKTATDQETSPSAAFPARLREASSESLHALRDRFFPDEAGDGAFVSEHRAAAAVRQADPLLTAAPTATFKVRKRDDDDTVTHPNRPRSQTLRKARRLIRPRNRTLRKARQPETSSSEPPEEPETSSSEPPLEPSTTSHSDPPVPPSTTSASPPPPTSSSEEPPPATSSTEEDPTPTSTPPSSSLPPSSSSLPDTTLTTTTKPPSTANRPPSSTPTTETFTSTSPNGVVVIVTRTNYVPAGGDETPAPSPTGAAPSLQDAAVRGLGLELGSVLAAGMAGVAMLLVAIVRHKVQHVNVGIGLGTLATIGITFLSSCWGHRCKFRIK
ncbi:hypothetical protein VTH06DRAFT_6555 [Thermothelomyces fergusii]